VVFVAGILLFLSHAVFICVLKSKDFIPAWTGILNYIRVEATKNRLSAKDIYIVIPSPLALYESQYRQSITK